MNPVPPGGTSPNDAAGRLTPEQRQGLAEQHRQAGDLHVIFDRPVIPGNTGAAIRLCAGTGAQLHLAGPLGFNFEEKHVKRAGLDYHDLADVRLWPGNSGDGLNDVPGIGDVLDHITSRGGRVFAFTTSTETWHTDISYRPGDALLFGPEPTGLAEEVLADPRITAQVRIPMLPGRRSMNLSNAASVAIYEAWRQLEFPAAQ